LLIFHFLPVCQRTFVCCLLLVTGCWLKTNMQHATCNNLSVHPQPPEGGLIVPHLGGQGGKPFIL
jgi:hypothetical protein